MTQSTKSNKKSKRQKGQGCIFKRGKNYSLQYYVNGKKKVVSLKTTLESEAKARAKEYLPVIEAKTKEEIAFHVAQARNLAKPKAEVPLDEAYQEFYSSKSRKQSTSEGTLENYGRIFNRFKNWIKSNHPNITNLFDLDHEITDEYASYLWKFKISENTYNYHIAALKLIHNVISLKHHRSSNPWNHIAKKKEKKKTHKELNKKEVGKLFEIINDEKFYLKDKEQLRFVFTLGVNTGMRLADCILLKYSYIKNDLISCYPKKTINFDVKVMIPVTSKLSEELEKAKKWQQEDSDYVVPLIAERYLRNPHGPKKDAMKVFNKTGIVCGKNEILGFHSLRHTFITECIKNGMNIHTLSEITGDNIRTLEKYYIHLREETIKKSVGKIPSYNI